MVNYFIYVDEYSKCKKNNFNLRKIKSNKSQTFCHNENFFLKNEKWISNGDQTKEILK